jgi:hypothetical protein
LRTAETYQGFEVGPIRPPSEARSLLLRITRNCPWNRCKFCCLYKGEAFSLRSVEHILKDIDTIRFYVDEIRRIIQSSGGAKHHELTALHAGKSVQEQMAFHVALNWYRGGMTSVFFQDANSLIIKPDHLVEILLYIRKNFPQVERITSYARSHTVARISDEDMGRMAEAGLNRIHIGMESASDTVLKFVKKGVDKKTHVAAGQKVKRAGIELSEYYMPGLGGREYSRESALETADAMNRINPDFIRIRTLAVPDDVELFEDWQAGRFNKCSDIEAAGELLLFLQNLGGITSTVKSDHILNLFQEVEGCLPDDKELMIEPIRNFLAMDAEQQLLYIVGRRTGIFSRLEDMNDPKLKMAAELSREEHQVTLDNIDEFTAEIMQGFI